MNNNNLAYLSELFCLLSNPSFSSSIQSMRQVLNTTITQLRTDMFVLLTTKESCFLFNVCMDSPNALELSDLLEKIINCKTNKSSSHELLRKQLLAGYYDETVLSIDRIFFDSADTCMPLYLSSSERTILAEHFPNLMKSNYKGYYIKHTTPQLTVNIQNACDTIQDAISNNLSITFRYRAANTAAITDRHITPKLLFHNTDSNIMYFIDDLLNIYRVDRILSPVNISKTAPSYEGITLDEKYFDYLWGISDCRKEKPFSVKLRIIPNTQNIINKIQDETRLRKYGKLEHQGNEYIYTDIVLGEANFRSWLRSYGSSIIVLEPESLAQKILYSAQKIKECYSSMYFIREI